MVQLWREDKNMIYDTGAQVTTMSRELANRLQINNLRTTADVPEFTQLETLFFKKESHAVYS